MSDEHQDQGPLFQVPVMTLRDWFAGQALAGLMAGPEGRRRMDEWARDAYNIADAMLEERKRGRAELTADVLKRLREASGEGLHRCQRALERAGGDYDEALRALVRRGR